MKIASTLIYILRVPWPLAMVLAAVVLHAPANSIEVRLTTADLVRLSPNVAYVRVVGSYLAEGDLRGFRDYTLSVIRCMKGSLPGTVMIRVPQYPNAEPYSAGTELLVFLGDRSGKGAYTLISHETGIIRVAADPDDVKRARYLMAPVTGTGVRGRWSLSRFESYVKRAGK